MAESPEVTVPVSPVAGWTPAPDDSTPEGLRAVLGAPTGPYSGIYRVAGVPPLPLRATSGAAASRTKAASRTSLIALFNEREHRGSSSAHPTAGTSNGNKTNSRQKVVQPPISHNMASKPRPAAPPAKMATQLVKASTCYGETSARGVKAEAQQDAKQHIRTGYRGQSSSNVSSRPASDHAVASVAAAEAAVSAAAAVLQPGKQLACAAATLQAAAPQPTAGTIATPAQQLLHSRRHPVKGSPAENHNNSSRGNPELSCLNSSTLSKRMLSDSLQVRRVPPDLNSAQHRASHGDGASTCRDSSPAAAGQPVADNINAAVTGQVTSNVDAAALQHQYAAELRHQQLMLQYSPPQTAAEIMAAKAKSRRLRIQQQAMLGQGAFLRRAVQPRPGSPPPVVLDGVMLLSSCPGAVGPSDVLFADMSACEISSVAMPQSEQNIKEAVAAAALGPPGASTASAVAAAASPSLDSVLCMATSCSAAGGHKNTTEIAAPETAASAAGAAVAFVSEDADQAAGANDISSGMVEAASWEAAGATGLYGPSLQEFSQLCSLCLSDNRLSCIAGLVLLPALQQLAVSANRLRGLQGLAQVLGIDAADSAPDTQQLQLRQQQQQQPQQQQQQQQVQQQASLQQDPTNAQCSTSRSNASNQQTSSRSGQQQQDEHRRQLQQNNRISTQQSTADVGPLSGPQPALYCPGGFGCLRELDLSFNSIPGDHLLGEQSPLAHLPRLCILHAAGNSVATLPALLGPFTSLSYLDLSHNRLGGTVLRQLGQLPALQQLLLGHNPIRTAVEGLCTREPGGNADNSNTLVKKLAPISKADGSCKGSSSGATASSACQTYKQLTQLDLSHTKVATAKQLLPLLQLQQLAVLQLVGTPLAARCWSGRDPLQELEKLGPCIITQEHEPQSLWHHSSKAPLTQTKSHQHKQQATAACSSDSSARRLLPVTVEDAAQPGHVLSAAGKSAALGLQHEQLVAVFERVDRGIETWQLTPVVEGSEGSEGWGAGSDEEPGRQLQEQLPNQTGGQQQQLAEDGEPVVDQTFITGVGITADWPGDDEDLPCSLHPAEDGFQDPTERLATAFGLQVCQLAHYTHKQPNNPAAAVHQLRHALAHPLVDADVGQRPPQHHTSMTAAAAAKQRPRQLLSLPQPIPTTLDTRVKAVQSIEGVLSGMRNRLQVLEGTLLQQLQAQSNKLSSAAQRMHNNAAYETRKNGS